MDYSCIFKRVEQKYLLKRDQYNALRYALIPYMSEDEYGLSTVSSIYFDTNQYDIIRSSLDKPVYKEKLRLRCYGKVTDQSIVFLELKKKYEGIVYKRRVAMEYEQVKRYLLEGIRPNGDSQIMNEIDYFIRFYHPTAKSFIAYDRVALVGRTQKSLRITFDQNIRTRFSNLHLDIGTDGDKVIKDDEVLMEVKVTDALPLWLVHILSELKIYPYSFSKYGSAYKQLLEAK